MCLCFWVCLNEPFLLNRSTGQRGVIWRHFAVWRWEARAVGNKDVINNKTGTSESLEMQAHDWKLTWWDKLLCRSLSHPQCAFGSRKQPEQQCGTELAGGGRRGREGERASEREGERRTQCGRAKKRREGRGRARNIPSPPKKKKKNNKDIHWSLPHISSSRLASGWNISWHFTSLEINSEPPSPPGGSVCCQPAGVCRAAGAWEADAARVKAGYQPGASPHSPR